VTFFRNLMAGDHGPLERVRLVAGNLASRNWLRGDTCCGRYGDPGC
jgi:hypothetical protein